MTTEEKESELIRLFGLCLGNFPNTKEHLLINQIIELIHSAENKKLDEVLRKIANIRDLAKPTQLEDVWVNMAEVKEAIQKLRNRGDK